MEFAAAVAAERREILGLFLEHGNEDIFKLVIYAVARNGWDDLLQRIFDEGKFRRELFAVDNDRPLRAAAESGQLSTCKLVIELSKRPRALTASVILPCVAMGGNLQVLDFFLREETKLDGRMYIPLIAAKKGHVEMLIYALDHGFHLQHVSPLEMLQYALFAAIAHQQTHTAEILRRRTGVGPHTVLFQRDDIAIIPLVTALDYVRLYDQRGRFIGGKDGGPKIGAGEWRQVEVKHQEGMEGVQTEYVIVTASGNDAVCINTVAVTWPGGELWGFLGDVGSMCGSMWYYSDVMVANSDSTGESESMVLRNRKSNCIWIDKDHSNNLKYAGFGYYVLDFGTSKDPDSDGRVFQYNQHPETICSSRPRFHNAEQTNTDDNIFIFWPQLEYNDDGSDKDLEKVTNQVGKYADTWTKKRDAEAAVNGPQPSNTTMTTLPVSLFAGKLVKSVSEQHDAHHLCGSRNSVGWDFVSQSQSLFCDMVTKQLWPICSETVTHSCLDDETDNIAPNLLASETWVG